MSKAVQYITNEQGKRVGVLLDLNTYSQLSHPWELDVHCFRYFLYIKFIFYKANLYCTAHAWEVVKIIKVGM